MDPVSNPRRIMQGKWLPVAQSLALSSVTLRVIADRLDQLAKIGVEIGEFKVSDVIVRVKRHDDQRDGTTYLVTEVRSADEPFGGPICRDASMPQRVDISPDPHLRTTIQTS